MKISRLTRILSLGLMSILILAAVGMTGAQSAKKILVTGHQMVGGDPETIDPALNQDSHGNQIISEIFVGLTRSDELTAEVKPGMAESLDISADGLTITYHLRKNIPWVHYNKDTDAVEEVKDDAGNVRMVTAKDFAYGWTRTLDPATASQYAYVLAPFVLNGEDFNAGKVDASKLGLKVVDDNTFEVTMPDKVGFAPNVHGLWIGDAQPAWAIEAGGDSWTEPENINTYGPFALKEWAHDESITLIKNPFWTATDNIPQPKLDEVKFLQLDPAAQFAEFQAGTADSVDLPVEQIDFVKSDATLSKEYSNGTQFCTYYVGFNTTKAPMTNAHIRLALSLAIDRQSIVDNVTKGGQIPAQWFARPGLGAAPTLDKYPDLGVKFDVATAKSELEAGLKELNLAGIADLPAITLAYNDSSGHAAIMQAIQQMWKDNLGITVQLSAMDPSTYFTTMNKDAAQAYRSGWCQDYPDADNFDNVVFHTGSSQNGTKYSDPAFDKLVDDARGLTDNDQRTKLYAQAEELLVKTDAAIAPIYWYTTNQVTKPYVERTISIIGEQRFEKWDINK